MPRKGCKTPGCEGPHVARGYCMRCYQQLRWHGKLDTVRGRRTRGGARVEDSGTYVMLSKCCSSDVRLGEQHESGNKYCTGCGEGCYWSYMHVRYRRAVI